MAAEKAAWYLLFDTPFDSSYPIAELYTKSVFGFLDGAQVFSSVVQAGSHKISAVTAYQHNSLRHENYSLICMLQFVREREFRQFRGDCGEEDDSQCLRSFAIRRKFSEKVLSNAKIPLLRTIRNQWKKYGLI